MNSDIKVLREKILNSPLIAPDESRDLAASDLSLSSQAQYHLRLRMTITKFSSLHTVLREGKDTHSCMYSSDPAAAAV